MESFQTWQDNLENKHIEGMLAAYSRHEQGMQEADNRHEDAMLKIETREAAYFNGESNIPLENPLPESRHESVLDRTVDNNKSLLIRLFG